LEPNDFEWMMNVSREHHAESDWSEVEYDDEKVARYIDTATNDPNHFGIVALKDEERIGFMVGRLLEYNFSREKFARELELYVEPTKRNGTAGIFMMRKFMDWAKINGAMKRTSSHAFLTMRQTNLRRWQNAWVWNILRTHIGENYEFWWWR